MFGGISIRLYLGGKVDRPYIRVVGVLDFNGHSRGRMPLALKNRDDGYPKKGATKNNLMLPRALAVRVAFRTVP